MINLFLNKELSKDIKWTSEKRFYENEVFDESIYESAIEHPLSESKESKNALILWSDLLGVSNLGVRNLDNIVNAYDKLTMSVLNDKDKKGYIINKYNFCNIYNEDGVTVSLKKEDDNLVINSCFLKNSYTDLFPLLYKIKIGQYNFFNKQDRSIIFYDDKLKDDIAASLELKNPKDILLNYINLNNDLNIYKLIKDYYEGNNSYNINTLKKYVERFEKEIDNIYNNRLFEYREVIDNENIAKDIGKHNKNIIFKITKIDALIDDYKSLVKQAKTKTGMAKIDKFIKTHQKEFSYYLNTKGEKQTFTNFYEKEIRKMYLDFKEIPKTDFDLKATIKEKLENEVYDNYLIAINYYMIMIAISLSGNTIESKYKKMFINKIVLNNSDLKEWISLINNKLLKN